MKNPPLRQSFPLIVGTIVTVLLISGCSEADHATGPVSGATSYIWRNQNPTPTSNNLLDVEFISSREAWACGTAGSLLHTFDGGNTWKESFVLPATALDIFFLDENTGWLAGGNGMIARTENGGRTWQQEFSGTTDLIRRVMFLNGRVGWATTSSGIILHTENSGITWRQISTIVGYIRDILFLDRYDGWAIGRSFSSPSGAGLFHTSDGGATWAEVDAGIPTDLGPDIPFADVSADLYSIASPDDNLISIVGEAVQWDLIGGIRLFSPDAGKTWSVELTNIPHRGVSFTPSGDGVAVGYGGVIYRSVDAGRTWFQEETTFGWTLVGLDMFDDRTGCAVGSAGMVVVTSDGVQTWTRISEGSRGFVDDIQFVDRDHGWVAGTDGVLLSVDGGESWHQTECTANKALQFFDVNHGLACDYEGNLDETHDGGNSWVRIKNAIESRVYDMCFVDTLTAWVAGSPAILRSDDGGRNWMVQWTGPRTYGIHFVDTLRGWAVGDNATIVATSDGGRHWTAQTSPVMTRLEDVFFLDSLHGRAVGGSSAILVTTDGGQNWNLQVAAEASESYLYAVRFVDLTTGWIVGDAGLVLATSDGGQSWTKEFTPTSNPLFTLCAVDKSSAWAAGWCGTIITTTSKR